MYRDITINVYKPHGNHKPKTYNRYTQKNEKWESNIRQK